MQLDVDAVAEQMRGLWRAEDFWRWPGNAVAGLRLSADVKRLLAEIGLPRETMEGYDIAALEAVSAERADVRVLGVFAGRLNSKYCIDSADGRVIQVEDDVDDCFVNTSAVHFAACWILFKKYFVEREPIVSADEIDMVRYSELFDRTEREIREIDPAAWGNLPADWRKKEYWKLKEAAGRLYWPEMFMELYEYYP